MSVPIIIVFICFDNYTGEPFFKPGDGERWASDDWRYRIVPITSIAITANRLKKHYLRWQLPLKAGHASTIHKCQGRTVPIVHFPSKVYTGNFAMGLDYVAISRARSLKELFLRSSGQAGLPLTKEHFEFRENTRDLVHVEYKRLQEIPRRVNMLLKDSQFLVFLQEKFNPFGNQRGGTSARENVRSDVLVGAIAADVSNVRLNNAQSTNIPKERPAVVHGDAQPMEISVESVDGNRDTDWHALMSALAACECHSKPNDEVRFNTCTPEVCCTGIYIITCICHIFVFTQRYF